MPAVALSLSPESTTAPEGTRTAKITWSFPQTSGFRQREVALWGFPGKILWLAVNPDLPEGMLSTNVFCANGASSRIVAIAKACGDTRDETAARHF